MEPGVAVTADRAALRGMLVNLIDNGRRHGGRVTVAVRAEDGQAVVEVADDGPGHLRARTASGSSTASTAPPGDAARRAPAWACRSPARPPSAGAAP